MQISDHIHAGGLVLTVEGRMDYPAHKVFQGLIQKTKLSRPQQIILNFYNVPSMDSVGLGLLMFAHKSLEEAKICLSLEVFEGYVLQVLTLANIGARMANFVRKDQLAPSGSHRLWPTPGKG